MVRELERDAVRAALEAHAAACTAPAMQPFVLNSPSFTCRSELVVRELERDAVRAARKAHAEAFMARALECFETGVAFVDTAAAGWRLLHCSSAFTRVRSLVERRLLHCSCGSPGCACLLITHGDAGNKLLQGIACVDTAVPGCRMLHCSSAFTRVRSYRLCAGQR